MSLGSRQLFLDCTFNQNCHIDLQLPSESTNVIAGIPNRYRYISHFTYQSPQQTNLVTTCVRLFILNLLKRKSARIVEAQRLPLHPTQRKFITMNPFNTSLLSSSSTSSLSSIVIVTPPYSGKDVLPVVSTSSNASSLPPRPSCIHHHPNHKKQQTRQVSWGLSDEIITVVNDDDGAEDTNVSRTCTTTANSYSRDRTVTIPNLPIQSVSANPTPTHHFPMSMATIDSCDSSSHSNYRNSVATTTTGIANNCIVTAATSYLELEQQFRLSPRQPFLPQEHHHSSHCPFTFQNFVRMRTNHVHYDDDDDSSCFTDIQQDDVDMENDQNHSDLDDFHRNHDMPNYYEEEDEDDDDDEKHPDILQTPDHTMYYYYDPKPPRQPQPSPPSFPLDVNNPEW